MSRPVTISQHCRPTGQDRSPETKAAIVIDGVVCLAEQQQVHDRRVTFWPPGQLREHNILARQVLPWIKMSVTYLGTMRDMCYRSYCIKIYLGLQVGGGIKIVISFHPCALRVCQFLIFVFCIQKEHHLDHWISSEVTKNSVSGPSFVRYSSMQWWKKVWLTGLPGNIWNIVSSHLM